MCNEEKHIPPTLEDVKRAFGEENVGKPFEMPVRHCRNVQKFIAKINEGYRRTKETCIQLD